MLKKIELNSIIYFFLQSEYEQEVLLEILYIYKMGLLLGNKIEQYIDVYL